jgi:hypothetical protein
MNWHPYRLAIVLLMASFATCGQVPNRGEFADQPNGLMYADSSMKKLSHMVDSLNLRFKVCDLSRTYYSNVQGTLWRVEFQDSADDLRALREDLDDNKPLDELLKKYKSRLSHVDTNLFAIEIPYREKGHEVLYLTGAPNGGYSEDYPLSGINKKLAPRKWEYLFDPKAQYTPENSVTAYFLPQALVQQPIPAEYAGYIQYVDCMIDTSTLVFLSKKSAYRFTAESVQIKKLNAYLNQKMKMARKKNDYTYDYITPDKVEFARAKLMDDHDFRQLLEVTIDSCTEDESGDDGVDALAAACISKSKALELKRHRIVVGACSQDESPRLHARDIAMLAAETNSWDIFLRAHLDIMNDRFERMSDGSYAYGGRKTYLKELEELRLDVVDLILGLSLRAANLPDNHYEGTVWRLGWAMSESKDKDLFEKKAIRMLKDDRLDAFNRGLIFILLASYFHHLDDAHAAEQKIDSLQDQANEFPEYLKTAILSLKTN